MAGKHKDKFGNGFESYPNYDVPEEWIPVIDDALDRIFELHPDTVIHQIKEKFGGLRIYLNNDYLDDVWEIILDAEKKIESL